MLVGMLLENALVHLVSGEDAMHLLVTDQGVLLEHALPLMADEGEPLDHIVLRVGALPVRARYSRPSRACSTLARLDTPHLPRPRCRPLRQLLRALMGVVSVWELGATVPMGAGLTFSWLHLHIV